ncbi:MAG: hypothetical protein V3575_04370 [Candidatus Absconditabacteria bacterium]
MKTFVLSLVFFGTGLMLFHIAKGWTGTDGLTAQDQDTLTAEKWNALNAKVESMSSSNGGWEEVSLSDTADFSTGCERKINRQDIVQMHIANTISTTKTFFILDNSNNWYYVYSNSKNLFRYEGNTTTRPINKIWKRCN